MNHHSERDLEGNEEAPAQPSNFVKYLTVVGSLTAVSLLAVSSVSSHYATTEKSATLTTLSTTVTATQSKRPEVQIFGALKEEERAKLFEDFQKKFNRKYEDDRERLTKYSNFQKFLSLIDHRNALEKEHNPINGAVHGITRFSDMSQEEFKKNFLGYRKPKNEFKKVIAKAPARPADSNSVDWTGKYTTAIKDQGYCGSCWAFSATSQIESDAIRNELLTTSDTLSPQQIVSCDQVDLGCNGGNTETAYQYVKVNGGLTTDAQYPYTSYWDVTGTCSTSYKTVVTVSGYSTLSGEDEMESYMLSTGPLSVCLDASTWSSYQSGIVSAKACGTDVDHCVQAVGVNLDDGYWIVRNSWGTDWGLDGYIWLETGANACYITYDPTFVTPTSV